MMMWRARMIGLKAAIGAFALLCLAHPAFAQSQCSDWLSTFGPFPGVGGFGVEALAVFDDGTGPALYVAGAFDHVGTLEVNNIAKWDGTSWSAVGGGLGEPLFDDVFALEVFDDGSGPALYAAGDFEIAGGVAANRIAKWDGTSWSPLGSGVGESFFDDVFALAVFDDGTGPALYAGGRFTSAGGVEVNYIAKWDGTSWSALGSGIEGSDPRFVGVGTLTVFDDGTGPALYAGGTFHAAGGVPAFFIARWDGTTWSPLGNGLNDTVRTIAVFDDGTGPALYAGGDFEFAGGSVTGPLARWDGMSWSHVGTSGHGAGFERVSILKVFDDGTGAALYAGGPFPFESLGGVPANGIAKWDGDDFSPVGGGIGGSPISGYFANALTVFDDGTGPALYAGGRFEFAGDVGARDIARWDGAAWSALGSGFNGTVQALKVFDDGTGPAIFAAGSFSGSGKVVANDVVKWDGVGFSSLGSGVAGNNQMGSTVSALTVFDDGAGPALYVGGKFVSAGGNPANNIARWDGTSWSALGSGIAMGDPSAITNVRALAVFDDGMGSALYAGGNFTSAGGDPANFIARWGGSDWAPLGSGLDGRVNALSVFDDGAGPALYAGGIFTTAGGNPAINIAKWDGISWSPLGSGVGASSSDFVYTIAVFDDGTGPALYAAGDFEVTGGVAASRIAKWDGVAWSGLGSGVEASPFGFVLALTVFDDGTGAALYAGGFFTMAGGVAANGIAKWNGTSWSPLGIGLNSVRALAGFDDGTGPDLIVGGSFFASPAGDSFLARWGGPNGPVCPGDANADRVVDFADITAVLGNWLTGGAEGGDSDCDQSVDFGDITTILGNWQAPCP